MCRRRRLRLRSRVPAALGKSLSERAGLMRSQCESIGIRREANILCRIEPPPAPVHGRAEHLAEEVGKVCKGLRRALLALLLPDERLYVHPRKVAKLLISEHRQELLCRQYAVDLLG